MICLDMVFLQNHAAAAEVHFWLRCIHLTDFNTISFYRRIHNWWLSFRSIEHLSFNSFNLKDSLVWILQFDSFTHRSGRQLCLVSITVRILNISSLSIICREIRWLEFNFVDLTLFLYLFTPIYIIHLTIMLDDSSRSFNKKWSHFRRSLICCYFIKLVWLWWNYNSLRLRNYLDLRLCISSFNSWA